MWHNERVHQLGRCDCPCHQGQPDLCACRDRGVKRSHGVALPKVGDRVKLLHMPNDPDPVPNGSTGTVWRVADFGSHAQIGVNWDNGRSLNIVVPEDSFEVL